MPIDDATFDVALLLPGGLPLSQALPPAPAGVRVRGLLGLDDLVRGASTFACAVLRLHRLNDPTLGLLRLVRHQEPALPLILIVPRDADTIRRLLHVADEVLWPDEAPGQLWLTVERLCAGHGLTAASNAIRGAEHLSRQLKEALVAAMHPGATVRTISDLAAVAACDRRTLWRHWQQCQGGSSLRLEDVLDWLLLLKAVHNKGTGATWTRIADSLGCHEQTLARVARRLTGSTLAQLTGTGYRALATQFHDSIIGQLVRRRDPREGDGVAFPATPTIYTPPRRRYMPIR